MPGYQHTPAFKNGEWDGYKEHLSYYTHTFPTGMLPRVYFLLKKGYDPLDEKERVIVPGTPIPVRFHLMAGSSEHFNPNFVNYYMDKGAFLSSDFFTRNSTSINLEELPILEGLDRLSHRGTHFPVLRLVAKLK